MSQVTGNIFGRLALYFFMGVGGVFFLHSSSFASGEPQGTPSTKETPSVPSDSSSSRQSPPPTGTRSLDEKGQQELDALRQKPEEFRTLITGVQIFLGRFGYGVGPYTGMLDQTTKNALKRVSEKKRSFSNGRSRFSHAETSDRG